MLLRFVKNSNRQFVHLPQNQTRFAQRFLSTQPPNGVARPRRRWIKVLGGTMALTTGFYIWDREFNASSLVRNAWTLYTVRLSPSFVVHVHD